MSVCVGVCVFGAAGVAQARGGCERQAELSVSQSPTKELDVRGSNIFRIYTAAQRLQ